MVRRGLRIDARAIVPRPYYQKVDSKHWVYVRVYPERDSDKGFSQEDKIKGAAMYYCTYQDCPMHNSRRASVDLHLLMDHEIDVDDERVRQGGIPKWKAKEVPTLELHRRDMLKKECNGLPSESGSDNRVGRGQNQNVTSENIEAENDGILPGSDDDSLEVRGGNDDDRSVDDEERMDRIAMEEPDIDVMAVFRRPLLRVIVLSPVSGVRHAGRGPIHDSDVESGEASGVEESHSPVRKLRLEDGESSQANRLELPARHRNPSNRFTPR
ncbi:hypothetical protein R1sor_024584 [Riccia sorocarpa]|uniref:Uncharacterized protein n=1 Tax=Riccia sorocarpa TaxID=122646 RepID=A0ABD3GR35_9MARC